MKQDEIRTVLIVDDDPGGRKSLGDILELKGYEVFSAADGKSAIELAQTRKIAIAIIDLKLPDMDGHLVLEEIKKVSPITECILLTGYASQDSAIQAINQGAFSYMQKPYEMEFLLLTIQRALEKRQAFLSLQQAAQEWRNTFDAMQEVVTIQDNAFRIIRANQATSKVFGKPLDQIIGKHCYEVFHAQGCPIEGCVYHQVQSSKHAETVTIFEPTLGLWLEVSATPLLSPKGELEGIVHVVRNVSQYILQEQTIRQQARDLGLLHELNTAFNRGEPIEKIIAIFNNALREAFGLLGGMVMLLSEDEKHLRSQSVVSEIWRAPIEALLNATLPFQKPQVRLSESRIIASLFQRNQPLVLEDCESICTLLADLANASLPAGEVLQKVLKYLPSIHETFGLNWVMAVPLHFRLQPFGLILLFSRKCVKQETLARLQPIIQQIESLFLRRLSQERLKQRVEELSLLYQVSQACVAARSEHELLEKVTHLIGSKLYPDHFGILLLDELNQILRVPSSYIGLSEEARQITIRVGEGVTGRVVASGEAMRIDDSRQTPFYISPDPGLLSELCVPIKVGEKVLGVINTESRQTAYFTSEDEQLLSTIAGILGMALQNVRLLEDERRRAERLSAILELNVALSEYQDEQTLLASLVEHIAQIAESPTCSIFLISSDEQSAVIVAHKGLPGEINSGFKVPLDYPLIKSMLERGEPLILWDIDAQAPELRTLLFRKDIHGYYVYPLVRGNRVLGAIAVSSLAPRKPSEAEVLSFRLLANRLAVALENLRLYQQERQTTKQLTLLNRLSQKFATSFDLGLIYRTAYIELRALFDCPIFGIYRFQPTEALLKAAFAAINGEIIDASLLPDLPAGKGNPYSKAIRTRRPVILADLQKTHQMSALFMQQNRKNTKPAHSALIVPLIQGEEVMGILHMQSYEAQKYTSEDAAFLSAVGTQLALAISNAELFQETRKQIAELGAISRVSTALRSAENVAQILPILIDEILQLLGTDTGAILLYDGEKGELYTAVARGWMTRLASLPLKPGRGIGGVVFQSGQVYTSEDFTLDPLALKHQEPLVPPGWGGVCLPIHTATEVIGIIYVAIQHPRRLDKDEIHLLQSLTEIAGSALHRSQLHEQTLKRVQELTALRTVDQAIISSMDLSMILEVLLTQATSLLKVDAAAVLLIDPYSLKLQHAANYGFYTRGIEQTNLFVGQDIAGRVAMTRQAAYIPYLPEATEFERLHELNGENFHAYYCAPLLAKGKISGVLELFHRSPLTIREEWKELVETLSMQAAIAIENARLFEEIQQSHQQLAIAYESTLEGWARALELRDAETRGHTMRTMELTCRIAELLGMREEEMVHIRRGVLLHDIGKMGVPDTILLKPGPLTEEEWVQMRKHPQYAFDLLAPISYLRPALDIPYNHHERWDGSGYPNGLKGEQIPLSARIFAVVDVYDALTSDRPYRPAWPRDKARAYIQEQAGKQFDPKIVELFLKLLEEGAGT